jgi:hypothetical protein
VLRGQLTAGHVDTIFLLDAASEEERAAIRGFIHAVNPLAALIQVRSKPLIFGVKQGPVQAAHKVRSDTSLFLG